MTTSALTSQEKPEVRILIPVHNAPVATRRCVEALVRETATPFALELIDDASCHPGRRCAEGLEGQLRATLETSEAGEERGLTSVKLVRQETNRGFVETVNAAVARATEPFLVILNSDVTVSRGWLGRLLAVFDERPRAALVCPLSSAGGLHSLPLPPGWSAPQLAAFLAQSGRAPFDAVTANGCLMMLRRDKLPEGPLFDEAYSPGYGEECELSMQLRAAGQEVLIAPTVWVHHEGEASFAGRKGDFMASANWARFMERWSGEYHRGLDQLRAEAVLATIQADFPRGRDEAARLPALLQRMIRERGLRWVLTHAMSRGPKLVAASIRGRGLRRTLGEAWRRLGPSSSTQKRPREGRLCSAGERPRVLLLLDEIGPSGGTATLVALANGLIQRGWDLRVLAPREMPLDRAMLREALFEPLWFSDERDLVALAPHAAVGIAGFWATGEPLAALKAAGRVAVTVHLHQDDEAGFYDDPGLQTRVREVRALADHHLATSAWLADRLASSPTSAVTADVMPVGIALEAFAPGPPAAPPEREEPLVVGLLRPDRPRRRPELMLELLGELAGRGDCRPVLFGSPGSGRSPEIAGLEQRGRLSRGEVAALLASAEIYVDGSLEQAFGLPNLEAMASGCAVIGPKVGGWPELAAEVGVTVPPSQAALAGAIDRLLRDPDERRRRAAAGPARAAEFSLDRFIAAVDARLKSLVLALEDEPRQSAG